jgi:D-methionine transport system substrate-binding protein
MKTLQSLALGLLTALSLSLAGCAQNTIDDKTIVIAASPTPHALILEQTRTYLEAQGYTLEIREFDDYVVPNTVTQSGEVDANYFQHQPYLTQFNAANNTTLVSVLSVHFEPLGFYLGRASSTTSYQNARIGIANDSSNGARGLLLLAQVGIISVDTTKGLLVTKNDITANPHNITIVELDPAAIPTQLTDLDFGVINGNYALAAQVPSSKLIASEATQSLAATTYANILVVKEGNETKPAILALIAALEQASITTYINEEFNGVVVSLND